ncbi:MAG: nicotinate-nucleotide adenylyltransferase [Clostridium sp.]|jgi:nicotinate-nucleotide adenylyltransferase
MEKLGIMGGTFDPIHLAHIYIAEEAKRQLNLDKVLFMPAGSQPLKINKNVTKASLRLEMVKEAIKGIDYFEVSDYEIKKKGMSYTYLTVENFKAPNRKVFFITGADCLMDLEMWNGVNRIFNACEFVVFTRPGYDEEKLKAQKMKIEEKYNKKVILIHVNSPNISSTMIREKIRDGKKVDNLLSKNVLNIIQKEGLYKE